MAGLLDTGEGLAVTWNRGSLAPDVDVRTTGPRIAALELPELRLRPLHGVW